MNEGGMLESAKFKHADSDHREWNLRVFPDGNFKDNKGYLSVFLVVNSSEAEHDENEEAHEVVVDADESDEEREVQFNHTIAKASFTVTILNSELKKTDCSWSIRKPNQFTTAKDDYGWARYIKSRDLLASKDKYLQNDTLILQCDINLKIDTTTTSSTSHIDADQVSKCQLNDDLDNLFKSGDFSDVSLCVGEHKIAAHKNILAARSVVFRAMFENECLEAKSGTVHIKDMDFETIEEMLKYIYTGRLPILTMDNASGIFAAADKYCLEDLKQSCEVYLESSLSVDNCVNVLMLADLHSAHSLKHHSMAFIRSNPAVIGSAQWKGMIEWKPELATEMCLAFASKKN